MWRMDFRELMQANWDARAPVHAASGFYARDLSFWFADFEWADLGEPGDVSLAHVDHAGSNGLIGVSPILSA
jgi:hypothetical protein